MSDTARPSPWQTLINAINDGLAILDRNGRVMRCNASLAASLGRPQEQVIGLPCRDLVPGGPEFCPFGQVVQSRQRVIVEQTVGDRWFRVTLDPVRDPRGAVAGA